MTQNRRDFGRSPVHPSILSWISTQFRPAYSGLCLPVLKTSNDGSCTSSPDDLLHHLTDQKLLTFQIYSHLAKSSGTPQSSQALKRLRSKGKAQDSSSFQSSPHHQSYLVSRHGSHAVCHSKAAQEQVRHTYHRQSHQQSAFTALQH